MKMLLLILVLSFSPLAISDFCTDKSDNDGCGAQGCLTVLSQEPTFMEDGCNCTHQTVECCDFCTNPCSGYSIKVCWPR